MADPAARVREVARVGPATPGAQGLAHSPKIAARKGARAQAVAGEGGRPAKGAARAAPRSPQGAGMGGATGCAGAERLAGGDV